MLLSNRHAFKLIALTSQASSINQSVVLGKSLVQQANRTSKRTMVSSDYNKFREILNRSRHVVAITGAGISAESGMERSK